MRKLSEIFKKRAPGWSASEFAEVTPWLAVTSRKQDRKWAALWGYVLMACVEEQAAFMIELWNGKPGFEIRADVDFILAFKILARAGKILDVCDVENPEHWTRIMCVYLGVQGAQGKL